MRDIPEPVSYILKMRTKVRMKRLLFTCVTKSNYKKIPRDISFIALTLINANPNLTIYNLNDLTLKKTGYPDEIRN